MIFFQEASDFIDDMLASALGLDLPPQDSDVNNLLKNFNKEMKNGLGKDLKNQIGNVNDAVKAS